MMTMATTMRMRMKRRRTTKMARTRNLVAPAVRASVAKVL